MPAKKRCEFQSSEAHCNQAVLRIVGQCPHCRLQFCGDSEERDTTRTWPEQGVYMTIWMPAREETVPILQGAQYYSFC
ncbi:hypothetical protein L226DRAFT_576496 [Lentinus tigrinus ALCF2SS1-7]|uniref:Uncharacterized protein n=1 Tax=Lentinus tigrinus ALCF2SS1-6 TaxID=1328759 RepID=A0A5C2RNQ9_9APHY|nr:hypothetical protein L227DRAFT_617156 [Lentinus tigrinus ALCF2SS1-6]RPD68325.1 hypothetical protein L226DRAFT_576496 [Lentinus tigrinus ALCF2SS1-7]